ncbi:MAG: amino acid racemase [Defluviitaleaceae bacterium]|nr:amino acid racemase [Defluviitaleaceae bacterium]
MKKLGILGGMGPFASALFFEMLTRSQKASSEQDYINIFLSSNPSVPDRTNFINGGGENPVSALAKTAKALERIGADAIAIPCVTAHFFYDEISASVAIPILNIVEETAKHLFERGVKKAGLLATEGTVRRGLFGDAFSKYMIETILPGDGAQKTVNDMIYQNLKKGSPVDGSAFFKIAAGLRERGAETVVLGCTELSLVRRDFGIADGFTDALEILAVSSLVFCGAELAGPSA